MRGPMKTIPNDLQKPGRELWRSLTRDYDLAGNEWLLGELCRTFDRLQEIRSRMSKAEGSDYIRLCGSEAKAAGTAARLWRLMGLPAADAPQRGKS